MTRRAAVALGAGVVAVVAVVTLWVAWGRGAGPFEQNRASRAVEELGRCTLAADVECVWRYLDPSEIQEGRITKEGLGSFLRGYVQPKFAGYRFVRVSVEPREGGFSGGYVIETLGRSEKRFMIELSATSEGLRAERYVQLLAASIAINTVPVDPNWRNAVLARQIMTMIERDRAALENSGLPGLVFHHFAEPTKRRYGTWQDWFEYYDAIVNRRPATPGPGGPR